MDQEEKIIMKELEIAKVWSNLAINSVTERYKILPLTSSLAATLLIVATFNKELIPLTIYVKFLIAILLLLIPISIWVFLITLRKDENIARTKLEEITKEKKESSRFLLDIFPYIATTILTIIILSIITIIF